MRTRNPFEVAGLSVVPHRRHAVVVGGSMAGMLAARVLSDHFDDVTLLERDDFPETPASRKGLPQGRHVHVLLAGGRRVMEGLLPGLTDDLIRAGADPMDATQDVEWMGPYGSYVRFPGDLLLLACSRDLIDSVVRGRVAALPNVRIRQGINVAGLLRGRIGGAGVAGVRFRAQPDGFESRQARNELTADLVVVADGRNSRLPDWLTALGYEPPQETVVSSFQGYASRLYRPAAGFKADWKALYIQQAPPADPRGGLVSTVEGGRWLVSLIGGDGHYPPTDEAGFLDFARSLRSPTLYEAIVEAEPLTPIAGQRATENRLRHYNRLEHLPEGVVALGDAVCAFNPVYGQGMTAAALGAEVLDRWLRGESSRPRPGRGRAFQHALAKATTAAWNLSTAADHGFRTTEGPLPGRIARLTGRYIAGVMRVSTRRPWVRRRLTEVLQLLRPPSALFGPGVLARLAWDWFSRACCVGYRRLSPHWKGTHSGLWPPLRSVADLDFKTRGRKRLIRDRQRHLLRDIWRGLIHGMRSAHQGGPGFLETEADPCSEDASDSPGRWRRAGRGSFPVPPFSPRTVRADDQREAKPIAPDLVTAIRNADAQAVGKLIDNGADVNARDAEGNTPLILASFYASPRCVALLLEKGALVNAANKAGVTALIRSATNYEKTRLLVDAGAKVRVRTADFGNTPLILAARRAGNSRTVKLLLERGADANEHNNAGISPIISGAASGDLETVQFSA